MIVYSQPPIAVFENEHAYLSNFYPSLIEWQGWIWPTVEHAYQWAKDPTQENVIKYLQLANSPGAVKRIARRGPCRPDWQHVKVDIMRELLMEKFKLPELRAHLLATGTAWIEEGNAWGDTFWGVCPPGSGQGQNVLGRLLMAIRADLAAS